jgi:hypothetical protein
VKAITRFALLLAFIGAIGIAAGCRNDASTGTSHPETFSIEENQGTSANNADSCASMHAGDMGGMHGGDMRGMHDGDMGGVHGGQMDNSCTGRSGCCGDSMHAGHHD